MTTTSTGIHPVTLPREPRRMFLAGIALQFLATLLTLAGYALLALFNTWALAAIAAAVVALLIGRALRRRSWLHVAWKDQADARMPAWLLILDEALNAAVLVAFALVMASLGTVALGLAVGLFATLAGINTTGLLYLRSKPPAYRFGPAFRTILLLVLLAFTTTALIAVPALQGGARVVFVVVFVLLILGAAAEYTVRRLRA